MFSLVIVGFLFVFGLCIGSFLSVVAARQGTDDSWARGRSRCDSCKMPIAWYDNVPLVSFIVLRGRCRGCKCPIPLLFPVVELLTASLFVWWYWFGFGFFRLVQSPLEFVQPLFWLIVGLLFLVIFVTDMLYFLIPNWTVIVLSVLVLLYRSFLVASGAMQFQDLHLGVGVMAVMFFLFYSLWWLTNGRGFGYGDVKLIIPLSILMDWQEAVVAVFLAFCIGAILGCVLLLFGKVKRLQPIPFGPFLLVGTLTALLYGRAIFDWYINFLS